MNGTPVDPGGVVLCLERARGTGPSGLAFDADGTLWSGDVGDDTFTFACKEELIREEARDLLERTAREQGVPASGSPSRFAWALFEAYRRGEVGERLICEVMTWSYAGYAPTELESIANQALTERDLAGRFRRELEPALAWARREALRVVIISASPRIIVEAGLAQIGLTVDAVGAAAAARDAGGKIAPEMAEPLPYAERKVVVGRALLAGADWLATFGDNAFDVDMLRAARVRVAVFPKPALRARLAELDGVLVLE